MTNEKCETTRILSGLARDNKKYIIAGSMPETVIEEKGERVYNTCLCFDREGNIAAKHRKLHLFDIDVPGYVTSMESVHVKPGPPAFTIFETEYCKVLLSL